MLAPRKKLWSTPKEAIEMAGEMVSLSSQDVLYDVGCGDGRVLIHLASTTDCQNFVGIEIDADRAQEARENVRLARIEGRLKKLDANIEIYCENALDISHYHEASVIFLYLVPRGLRIIHPILRQASSKRRQQAEDLSYSGSHNNLKQDNKFIPSLTTSKHDYDKLSASYIDVTHDDSSLLCSKKEFTGIKVVTYMAGFEGEKYVDKQTCTVKHQSGSAWPIYYYHFDGKTSPTSPQSMD